MANSVSRSGLKDVWNAFMCNGAIWSPNDIPWCPTKISKIPTNIITWPEAKEIYKKSIRIDKDFKNSSFVCFYCDDYKFDGTRQGIWANPHNALNVLQHFQGIITPDFSTYQDFPYPLKIYNTFRMRAFGLWAQNNNLEVINNVRWGTDETYSYCFDGIAKNSIVAIGTVGGNPKKLKDRKRFEDGLSELVRRLNPKTIIVYGSSRYQCFQNLRESNIDVIEFHGTTSNYFSKKGDSHE